MKKLSVLAIFGLSFFVLAQGAFAQGTTINPCPLGGGGNFDILCNATLEGGFIRALITIAFIVATLIALAFLIWGGIKWITSGGDKGGVEAARNTIVAALVGLVIVFLAYLLLSIVFSLFNLNFGDFTLPDLNLTGTNKAPAPPGP
jgi:hypothetical protein